jgi:hypothetical protein
MYILLKASSLRAFNMTYSTYSSIVTDPPLSPDIYPYNFFLTTSKASLMSTLMLLVLSIKGS